MYENVHPNLALVPFFKRTEVECRKGLFSGFLQFKVHFGLGQNNSECRDRASLKLKLCLFKKQKARRTD